MGSKQAVLNWPSSAFHLIMEILENKLIIIFVHTARENFDIIKLVKTAQNCPGSKLSMNHHNHWFATWSPAFGMDHLTSREGLGDWKKIIGKDSCTKKISWPLYIHVACYMKKKILCVPTTWGKNCLLSTLEGWKKSCLDTKSPHTTL